MRRAVVTGIGLVTPIGMGKEQFWESLVQGKSSVDKITKFDVSDFKCQIGSEIKDFDPLDHGMEKKEDRRIGPFSQYAIEAAIQQLVI
jgi:3-oxoacyl-[acyl-carrier-protein] synthase II